MVSTLAKIGLGVPEARTARLAEEASIRETDAKAATLSYNLAKDRRAERDAKIKDEKERMTVTLQNTGAIISDAYNTLAKAGLNLIGADPAHKLDNADKHIAEWVKAKNAVYGNDPMTGEPSFSESDFKEILRSKVKDTVLTPEQEGAAAGAQKIAAFQGATGRAPTEDEAMQLAGITPQRLEFKEIDRNGAKVIVGLHPQTGAEVIAAPAGPLPFKEAELKAVLGARIAGLDPSGLPGVGDAAVKYAKALTPEQAAGLSASLASGAISFETGPGGTKFSIGGPKTTSPGDFSTYRNIETQVRGFMRQAERLRGAVEANPTAVQTNGVVQFINSAANLAKGVVSLADASFTIGGQSVQAGDYKAKMEGQFTSVIDKAANNLAVALGGTAKNASEIRSALTEMTFQFAGVAAAQQGRSVTEEDYRRFLAAVGDSRDPAILLGLIGDAAQELEAITANRAKQLNLEPPDFRSEFPGAFSGAKNAQAAPEAPADPAQREIGKVYTGAGGRRAKWTAQGWELQ